MQNDNNNNNNFNNIIITIIIKKYDNNDNKRCLITNTRQIFKIRPHEEICDGVFLMNRGSDERSKVFVNIYQIWVITSIKIAVYVLQMI